MQEFIRNGGDLANLGITATEHESLPLRILNYSQINSPKTNPIVRECRGLVLRTDTHELVARSFSRFFNWGEVQDEMKVFDFSDCVVQTKEDGSLVLLYHFDGKWMANTRGSFGQFAMEGQSFTWQQGICAAMQIAEIRELTAWLDPSLCYVCEFCSPWNKVVRQYAEPSLFLLTAFHGETELHWNDLGCPGVFKRTARHQFGSITDIQEFLTAQSAADPTFEGVVIRDKNGRRFKIKSPSYLGLHRLKGDAGNLFLPKNLLPFVLSGEESELMCYFPEAKDKFQEVKEKTNAAFGNLQRLWAETWQIPNQKDFALAIVGRTPFTGTLFSLRKTHGQHQSLELLKKTWRDSADVIVKTLF